MGPRRLILLAVLAGCPQQRPETPTVPAEPALAPVTGMGQKVVADFERATLTSREAYVALFDFAAVGEMEILIHRYDLNGRLEVSDDERARFSAEDGTPYPAERERKNVGNFYDFLATRTVGAGHCRATVPRTTYGKGLGEPYEPLPAGSPPNYEILRTHANAWLANGGIVRIGGCTNGKGGLALVWTARDTERGYDLITIYDD